MVKIEGVTLEYKDGQKSLYALKEINLSIEEGECLGVVGRSGCGKTSLLHVMAGLTKPSEGAVYYKGRRITGPIPEISIIFQNFGLFPWKTVYENVVLPFQIAGKEHTKNEIHEVLELLNLMESQKKYPAQLSGGQKQKVAIGRAILNDAELILMDEPFSALDAYSREQLQRYMMELFELKKLTCVLVTHSIEEALLMGRRVAVFNQEGSQIENVLENSGYKEKNYLESDIFFSRGKVIRRKMMEETDEKEIF